LDNLPVQPLVSVVIPSRDRTNKLSACLESVFRSDYERVEVIVVDDASKEPLEVSLSGKFPNVRFIRNATRLLLSCSRNRGAAAARGGFLFFLDDDNVIDGGAIRTLLDSLDGDETAVACPIIYYQAEPKKVWTSYIDKSKFPGFYTLHTDVPPATSETFSFHNAFLVKRSVFDEIRGFDCVNLPIRFSEVDFAHKLNAKGYKAVVNPAARVWHDLGWSMVHIDSVRAYYTERNRIIVIKRYFRRRDLMFYSICLLPIVGGYYLVHHPLSTSDNKLKTASNFLRGIADGIKFKDPDQQFSS
jgi:GT2 family glycosyltransferase